MLKSCPRIIKGIVIVFVLLFLYQFSATNVDAQTCGNGACQPLYPLLETCSTCPEDCGVCPTPTPTPTAPPTPTPTPTSTAPPSTSTPTDTGPTYFPSVFLEPLESKITNATQLSFSGYGEVEQGTINKMQYSLDNGLSWITISPSDGKFDSSFEKFSFTLSFSEEGQYSIAVRATSLAQVSTQAHKYGRLSFTVVTTSPEVSLDIFQPNPTRNQAPVLSGNTTPSRGSISSVEISLDNGLSWYQASLSRNAFNYTPQNLLEDGNYEIIARATDSAGNIGYSDVQTIVIDTIPPIIGGNMFSFGSQVLEPNSNGHYSFVAGVPLTIGLSTKGGVIKANVVYNNNVFPLTRVPETNLWTGNIIFDTGGEISPEVIAIDGANNETRLTLNTFIVESAGSVTNNISKEYIAGAEVSVYFYDSISKSWTLWDGKSYDQENSQVTGAAGTYSFIVPEGKYYIETKASRYKTMRTEILTFSESNILNFSFQLNSKPGIKLRLPLIGNFIIPLPYFPFYDTLSDSEKIIAKPLQASNELEGTLLPDFELFGLDGRQISPIYFLGSKTLLTFLSTWSPLSTEQVSILEKLNTEQKDGQLQFAIFLQESSGSLDSYLKRGKYTFPAAADESGLSSKNFNITTLPTHFFVDSQGIIQEVYVGVLEEYKLLEKINGLN